MDLKPIPNRYNSAQNSKYYPYKDGKEFQKENSALEGHKTSKKLIPLPLKNVFNSSSNILISKVLSKEFIHLRKKEYLKIFSITYKIVVFKGLLSQQIISTRKVPLVFVMKQDNNWQGLSLNINPFQIKKGLWLAAHPTIKLCYYQKTLSPRME